MTRLWLRLMVGVVLLTALACGYALLEIGHEQELRGLGGRVRQVENRLRQTETQLQLSRRENEELRSELVCQQAALAMVGGHLGKTQLLQVARSR